MVSMYDELLKHSNKAYDATFVNRALLQIKKSNNQVLVDDLKLKIFFSQSKLLVKAINNFFSLVKTCSEEKVIHTREDIASECYLVMSTCIRNLKIKDLKKFYFYLNTSLNRAMYRLFERNYKKHFDIVNNNDDTEALMLNTGYIDHFDLTEIDLKGFSELEIKIIKFKYSGERLSVFLKIIKVKNVEYQEMLEVIKLKLTKLYNENKS